MKKRTPLNSKKRNSTRVKKLKARSRAVNSSAEIMDLITLAEDDGWGDCLDDDEQQPSAVGQPTDKRSSVAKKKLKLDNRVRPKAPKPHLLVSKVKSKKPPLAESADYGTPKDPAYDSLWKCRSIAGIESLHGKWVDSFRVKSLDAIQKRKLENAKRSAIAALLAGSATDIPILSDGKMLKQAWQFMHRAIWAATQGDPEVEFALVTFISGDGGTSSDAPFIELYRSQQKVLKVLRSMAKDFIGVTELAMFNSHGHPDGGRHIQRHEHALIWGKGVVKKAKDVAKRRMAEFMPNITGARQIDVREVDASEINLARVCAYLFKPPHKCMNWNPRKNGKKGHMNQSEKGDRMIRYLRMAQIRSIMTLEDIMYAGGCGVNLRSALKNLVRQNCRGEVPEQSRLLHPDEIGRFWLGVNAELKRLKWQLPVIARQP